MYTAVVKFDTLADPVRTAAEDHDFRLIFINRIIIRGVICRIVISAVFRTAHVNTVPGFLDTELDPSVPDVFFRNLQDLAEIFVRETILLGLNESLICRETSLTDQKCLFFLNKLFHLLDKVFLYPGELVDLIDCCALSQSFIHDKMTLTVRSHQKAEKFFSAQFVEVLYMAQTIAAFLERTDRLLEGFLIVLTDAHDFADSTHLCSEFILDALEFFKCPSCELYDNIVAVRDVLVKRSVFAAGKL